LADIQHILQHHFTAAFAATTVAVHLATINGLLGQRAGLEEACGPQPFIQPDFAAVGLFSLAHVGITCRSSIMISEKWTMPGKAPGLSAGWRVSGCSICRRWVTPSSR